LLSLRKAMNEAYTSYVSGGSTDKNLLARYNQLKTEYQNKVIESKSSPTVTAADNSATMKELLEQKSDLEVDIEASTANISSLQTKIDNLKGNVAHDASKGVAVETLMKEVELANKEYLEAKKKFTDASDINTSSLNNFRQVLYGQPAIEPEPSKKMLMVGMAGAAAMIITVLIIIVLTYLDASIKTPVIFSKQVNLKLISMINFMNLKNKNLSELISSPDEVEGDGDKRHNVFRESLRKLRYEIESSGKKVFLFTSTKKGQGKTTLIQALSYSLSQSKKKVLVIDTNFCNPDLTTQMNASPILEKIDTRVADNQTIVEQVKTLSKNIEGTVYAIGSEGGDYTPSEILPRQNLLHHLHALTAEFDFIFLEGPPLNDFSDSKELAQYVDGVIAIFSATNIIKQIDKESIGFFKELNGKFSGAVLNMVDLDNVNVT
jgi:polysaccharide biosynthesis transport protein